MCMTLTTGTTVLFVTVTIWRLARESYPNCQRQQKERAEFTHLGDSSTRTGCLENPARDRHACVRSLRVPAHEKHVRSNDRGRA